jgi:hypothetical protein
MKKSILFLIIIVIMSCSKSTEDESLNTAATISTITPLKGERNTLVTINGSDFGTDSKSIQVLFNGKTANIKSITPNNITVSVPSGAFTGVIKIIKSNKETTGPTFEYIPSYDNVSTVAKNIFPLDKFRWLPDLVMDLNRSFYVTDYNSFQIKKIDKTGVVTDFVGKFNDEDYVDGVASIAKFGMIGGMTIDSKGNLYVVDHRRMDSANSYRIRKITPEGNVSTFSDPNSHPQLSRIAIDHQDNLYATDGGRIYKITPNGTCIILAGNGECGFADGNGIKASFCDILGLTIDSQGNLFVIDRINKVLRKITQNGEVSTLNVTMLINNKSTPYKEFGDAEHLCIDKNNNLYVTIVSPINGIVRITPDGNASFLIGGDYGKGGYLDGTVDKALIAGPTGIIMDNEENIFFYDVGNDCLRKITKEHQ